MLILIVISSQLDVAAEKTQQAILKGVEGFNQNNLKPTETQEKIVLPDKEGLIDNNTFFRG
jgi:hypothetical protein